MSTPINLDSTLPQLIKDFRRHNFGVPSDYWLTHFKEIGAIIDKYKLTPVHQEALGIGVKQFSTEGGGRLVDAIYDIRGGRKTPHLHYKGELYILNAAQWSELTKPVLEDFGKRIASAKTVSFESFMNVYEAAESIPQPALQTRG